jgi:hypothetical protein
MIEEEEVAPEAVLADRVWEMELIPTTAEQFSFLYLFLINACAPLINFS